MNYCNACGEAVSESARFCQNCGSSLDGKVSDAIGIYTNEHIKMVAKNVVRYLTDSDEENMFVIRFGATEEFWLAGPASLFCYFSHRYNERYNYKKITQSDLTDFQKRIITEMVGAEMERFEKRYSPEQLRKVKARMEKEMKEFKKHFDKVPSSKSVRIKNGMSSSELADLRRRSDLDAIERMINRKKNY